MCIRELPAMLNRFIKLPKPKDPHRPLLPLHSPQWKQIRKDMISYLTDLIQVDILISYFTCICLRILSFLLFGTSLFYCWVRFSVIFGDLDLLINYANGHMIQVLCEISYFFLSSRLKLFMSVPNVDLIMLSRLSEQTN
jgi:hypothetical protein